MSQDRRWGEESLTGHCQEGYGQQDTWVDGSCVPRYVQRVGGQGMALNMSRTVPERKNGGKLSFLKKYFSYVKHCMPKTF